MYKGQVLWDTTVYVMFAYMYVPHELFNRIDQEYMCREHIQCTIIRVLLFVPHIYMCKCSVCVYVCGFVYAVDRLREKWSQCQCHQAAR